MSMNLPGEIQSDASHQNDLQRTAAADIWCCIPIYNNAATIEDIAKGCLKYIANVVIVDDGSTDMNVAATLAALDVTVLVHPENQGKGAALQTGFAYIQEQGGAYAITLDGDGQHFPKDIPAFLEHAKPHMLTLGKRDRVQGHMPASSLFGREFSDFWIELETGEKICDSQSGFRLYPLQAMAELGVSSRHYNFEVEAVTRALWAGLTVTDVPVGVWYPTKEERVSSFDQRKDNLRLACLHTKLALRQLLPWPHRKVVRSAKTSAAADAVKDNANKWRDSIWQRNRSPVGLALAVGLSLLLPLMHGVWGAIAVLYFAWRWHFNAMAVLAGLVAGYGVYRQQSLGQWVGEQLVNGPPAWTWFVGSHVLGPVASVLAGVLVYVMARKCQPLVQPGAEVGDEASDHSDDETKADTAATRSDE